MSVVLSKDGDRTPRLDIPVSAMIEPEKVAAKIRDAIGDADIEVEDLTGGQDHFEVTVVSEAFEGKRRIQQHRMIYDALEAELEDETIHALSLSTSTPEG